MASIFYTNEPVVNMREKPTLSSKVVSQTTFAENIKIKNVENDWVYINTPEGYLGWIPKTSIIERQQIYPASIQTCRLFCPIYGVNDVEYGSIKTLPFNCPLQVVDDTDPRWIKIALLNGMECFIQKGDVTFEKKIYSKNDLATFSQFFLNLPYTWGGRSSFGYDCSGFVQMLYSQINILLPRNSRQQILDERFYDISLEKIEPGDLIFWGKSSDTISHVGLYLNEGKFIHAVAIENKPWIRISSLSDREWIENAKARPYRKIRQLKSTVRHSNFCEMG